MKTNLLRTVCSLAAVFLSTMCLTASAFDYYITGKNVNGNAQWSLSSPDCGFTDLGNGVYEWTGKILAGGFLINDGTWTDGNNTFGSNGTAVVLGRSYKYKTGSSVPAFVLDGVTEVINPKVTLNVSAGTILVESLGDDEPEDPDKRFENEGYAVLTVKTENGPGLETHLPQNGETVLNFDLDQHWEIASVKENGTAVAVSPNQTSVPVIMDRDKVIDVRIAYREPLEWTDLVSGTGNIDGTRVTLSLENGLLNIDGLESGDEIVIYTLSGQTIGRYSAVGPHVTVAPGQGVFIVLVNDEAIKVSL